LYLVDESNVLGKGTFGTVLLATDRKDGTPYAVKVFAFDKSGREECRREVQAYLVLNKIASQQRQQGGVEFVKMFKSGYDFFFGEKEYARPFVLLTLAEGGLDGEACQNLPGIKTLRDCEWSNLKEAAINLCKQMQLIHDAGYVLRDVKPTNAIFCLKLKKAFFVDMNFAAPVDTCVSYKTTLPYAHPDMLVRYEAERDEQQWTEPLHPVSIRLLRKASDVWALGLTLLDLLLTKAIGGAVHPMQMIPLHMSFKIVPPAKHNDWMSLHDGLGDLFRKMAGLERGSSSVEWDALHTRIRKLTPVVSGEQDRADFQWLRELVLSLLRFQPGTHTYREQLDSLKQAIHHSSLVVSRKRKRNLK
jgi:serine/threonine protein kinase